MSLRQLDLVLLGRRGITQRITSVEGTVRGLVGAGYGDGDYSSSEVIRPNLLANASFEYYQRGQTTAQNWSFSNASLNTMAYEADGSVTVTIQPNGTVAQVLRDPHYLEAGAYVLSVAARTGTSGRRISLTLSRIAEPPIEEAIHRIAPDGSVEQTDVLPADGRWYRFYRQGLVTNEATAEVIISCLAGSTGSIEIDATKFEFELGATGIINPTAFQSEDTGASTVIRNLRADNIVAGTLTVGGSSSTNPRILVKDTSDVTLVTIGDPSDVGGFRGIDIQAGAGLRIRGTGNAVISGGGSLIVGTPGGERTEVKSYGVVGYDSGNHVVFALNELGAVGSLDIDDGDVLIGNGGTHYAWWDNSEGKLKVKGDISASTITGSTFTGGTFQTATSGRRIVTTSAGMVAYNSSGTAVITLAGENDGALVTNGGIRVGADGIQLRAVTGTYYSKPGSLVFTDVNGTDIGVIGASRNTALGVAGLYIENTDPATNSVATTKIISSGGVGGNTMLEALKNGSSAYTASLTLGTPDTAGETEPYLRVSLDGSNNRGNVYFDARRVSLRSGLALEDRADGFLRLGDSTVYYSGLLTPGNFRADGVVGVGVTAPATIRLLAIAPDGTENSVFSLVTRNRGNTTNYMYIRGDGYPWVNVAWNVGSDRRWKTNIEDLGDELTRIRAVHPRKYQRVENGKTELGVIAQELQVVYPELVTEHRPPSADGSPGEPELAVDYQGLAIAALRALQQVSSHVVELTERVTRLEQKQAT